MKLSDKCTVLLAGDSVHSFPPDLGQGINSGLGDVAFLYWALDKTNDDFDAAAKLYGAETVKESRSLIEVQSYAYPYQYGHMPIKKSFAVLNFGFRLLLSKLMPWVFSPPAFFMIQDHTLKYSEIATRAKQTTRRIFLFSVIAAVLL
jgi:2-polyprenyl-6-methoxyphenol hydroxylase-like FAD-dependent oxidoreductase